MRDTIFGHSVEKLLWLYSNQQSILIVLKRHYFGCHSFCTKYVILPNYTLETTFAGLKFFLYSWLKLLSSLIQSLTSESASVHLPAYSETAQYEKY